MVTCHTHTLSFTDMECLSHCLALSELTVDGNPVANPPDHRVSLIYHIQSLRSLNQTPISVRSYMYIQYIHVVVPRGGFALECFFIPYLPKHNHTHTHTGRRETRSNGLSQGRRVRAGGDEEESHFTGKYNN